MTEPMTCYRHPDRETLVSCSECGRGICPDCMRFAPVGIRCPDHSGEAQGAKRVVQRAQVATAAAPGLVAKTLVGLNVGTGYGGDPDWGHGQWKGRGWVEGAVYDMTDPAVLGRVPFSVVDHVGRARCDGAEGWGLFEHGTFGRHDPSGFADWGSVAP